MVSLADVIARRERWHVELADCRFAMSCLPDSCIDCCATDPPYGLSDEPDIAEVMRRWVNGEFYAHGSKGGFMGHSWDSFVPGPDYWSEVYRVLKPGAHLFVFAATRTWDLMSIAIRFAGFENRDTIRHDKTGELLDGPPALAWMYGSGMPHSHNVSKAIDKAAGAERPVIGSRVLTGSAALSTAEKGGTYATNTKSAGRKKTVAVTGPATEAATRWDGYGTGLKPAWEVILVFRKPLARTVAENVQEFCTGALNIDACRVYTDWNEPDRPDSWKNSGHAEKTSSMFGSGGTGIDCHPAGRWPPNVLFTHSAACRRSGKKRVAADGRGNPGGRRPAGFGNVGAAKGLSAPNSRVYGDADGMEAVDAWRCAAGCPVAALNASLGEASDAGRYFPQFESIACASANGPEIDVPFRYAPKAGRGERDAGLDEEDEGNTHPTVKAKTVVQWLVRLGTPPGGVVLDPFAGSGTTGVAAMAEENGYHFIGIEQDPEHVATATQRIKHVIGGQWRTPAENAAEAEATDARRQLALF